MYDYRVLSWVYTCVRSVKKKVGHDIIYEGNKFTKKNKKSNGIKIKIYFPETGIVHIQVSVLFSTQEKIWEYTRFLIIIT